MVQPVAGDASLPLSLTVSTGWLCVVLAVIT